MKYQQLDWRWGKPTLVCTKSQNSVLFGSKTKSQGLRARRLSGDGYKSIFLKLWVAQCIYNLKWKNLWVFSSSQLYKLGMKGQGQGGDGELSFRRTFPRGQPSQHHYTSQAFMTEATLNTNHSTPLGVSQTAVNRQRPCLHLTLTCVLSELIRSGPLWLHTRLLTSPLCRYINIYVNIYIIAVCMLSTCMLFLIVLLNQYSGSSER